MVDDLVTLLGKEQVDDDNKKAYCEKAFDENEDATKDLTDKISDLSAAIDEEKDTVAAISDELAALAKGIVELDREVAGATAQRKSENQEFTENLSANNAAMQLIEMAKNRMQKFYNPKLYKPPPKRELSEEERITLNMGGTLAPTNAPGGIAGTGISALQDDDAVFAQVSARMKMADPPAFSQTFESYGKQSEEAGGVIAMMDMLKADLAKEIQEMEFEEKDSQGEYVEMVKGAAEKRASDTKSVAEKESARAGLAATLQKLGKQKKSRELEKYETQKALAGLHQECDFLLQNYGQRKEARANEVDALQKAKAVLSGADYSLLQTGVSHRHLRRVQVLA